MFEVDLQKHQPVLRPNNTVLCAVRKRLIHKTPEEVIRQSVIKYLIDEKGYPIGNIDVETPLSRKNKNKKGRADIIIYDFEGNALCLIECKEPKEVLTDRVIDQLLNYDEVFDAYLLCVVIGNSFYLIAKDEKFDEPIVCIEFPDFNTLFHEGKIEGFLPEIFSHEKYDVNDETADLFIKSGIFGKETGNKFYPFLINLYNFYIDESDKLNLDGYEDIGVKYQKYGNAGGGSFAGEYRAILEEKSEAIVSFSISSMTSGESKPVYTSLLFAVDIKGYFHLSLELRADKYIEISETSVKITHDGTITVGKLGAVKRSELIDFVKNKNPELVRDGKIFLGAFDLNSEITSSQQSTREFILNSISYALLRDEFRIFKKT
jgi:hypothetical protein